MLRRFGDLLSNVSKRYVPDPFVLAILLTLVTLLVAIPFVGFDLQRVLGAWNEGAKGSAGFWGLLAFAMQMCLILVTGHALAESPPLTRGLNRLADLASTPARAIVVVSSTAMSLGLINWGLGLIAGALLARKVGQRGRERGVALHYPLVVAAGYTGMLVWHGGLSGSAPLKATRMGELAEVLGAETAARIGAIGLESTIGSLSNIVVNLVLLVLVPVCLVRMLPSSKDRAAAPPLSSPPESQAVGRPGATPAERMGESFILVLLIVVPGIAALIFALQHHGLARLNLNLINFALLFVGLLLHGSVASYLRAVSEGARGCAGIIIQFPFYAGIMGLLAGTGLLGVIAEGVAAAGDHLLPAVGFYMAGLVNLFVPSGGGQWAVQGPLLVEAGLQAGVEPARMVMALAYGDQWTNMLQPFWALPLLAITQSRARDIIGYTAVLLVVAQVPLLIGLYLAF